jgi:hypothetical protein
MPPVVQRAEALPGAIKAVAKREIASASQANLKL